MRNIKVKINSKFNQKAKHFACNLVLVVRWFTRYERSEDLMLPDGTTRPRL